MTTREEVVTVCSELQGTYEDMPFRDPNWTVIRHKANKKVFAWIYEKEGNIWINVKCDPEWRDFWRSTYKSVIPGYHLNKEHWNSIILDGTVPEKDILRMIEESYALTKPKTLPLHRMQQQGRNKQ
ncbi:MAG: MmcQ/YjbR family DNA-binding protein [Lachnospiraceae bacterium]